MMTKTTPFQLIILILGFCVWILSAFFSDGFYQADEHFQIIEFANYKLGNIPAADLPWEYAEQMRPGLQPLLAFLLINASSWFTTDPFIQMRLLRIITALLAFSAGMFFIRRIQWKYDSEGKNLLMLALLFFLWFMPPLVVRFSSENLSGICMLLSLTFVLPAKKRVMNLDFFLAGLFSGLAFSFRYQSLIMTAGLFLWMIIIQKRGLSSYILFITGMILACAAGFLADRWLYDEWVFAPWNYFNSNFLQGKLSTFGVKPWHHYFSSGTEQLFLPIGITVWLAVIIYWITKYRSPLTWISLPFVLFHLLPGHKEVRFLFPLFFLIPVFLVQLAVVLSRFRFFKLQMVRAGMILLFFLMNASLIVMTITFPQDPYVGALECVHKSGVQPKKIYYTDNDPLQPYGLAHHFYHTPDIRTVRTDPAIGLHVEVPSDTIVFLFEEMKGLNYRTDPDLMLRSARYPVWLKMFNIGHWQERTSNWALYRVNTLQGGCKVCYFNTQSFTITGR